MSITEFGKIIFSGITEKGQRADSSITERGKLILELDSAPSEMCLTNITSISEVKDSSFAEALQTNIISISEVVENYIAVFYDLLCPCICGYSFITDLIIFAESILSEVISASEVIDALMFEYLLSRVCSTSDVTGTIIKPIFENLTTDGLSASKLEIEDFTSVITGITSTSVIVNYVVVFADLVNTARVITSAPENFMTNYVVLHFSLTAADCIPYNLRAIDNIPYTLRATDEVAFVLKVGG